jgi:phytoene dehydrogenase-like protein
MRRAVTSSKHVLVVGAGHNGLVAAVHLADAGLDVTVLEHAPDPGGATASSAATLPGFVHDTCAGFIPMAAASPAIRELGLERDGVQLLAPDVVMAHPYEDGSALALHRSLPATVSSLEAVAPGAGRAWGAIAQPLLPHVDVLVEAFLSPLPPGRPALHALARLRAGLIELSRWSLASSHALGLERFRGAARPTAWLSGSGMHSGLPPTTTASGGFSLILQMLGHRHGWPLVRGGTQRLADALVARVRALGGAVRCDAHVERLLMRDGRVRGVRLASGEEVAGDLVLSTLTARKLAAIVPPGTLAGQLVRRLESWRHDSGAFKLDYALSRPMPWAASAARSASVVHVAGELDDLVLAMQDVMRGAVPERPALVVGQQSLADGDRAPAGAHTLYVYTHLPTEPRLDTAGTVERVEARLDTFAPGWRSLVVGRAVRDLAQSEAENPNLVRGDLAGGSYQLDQQLLFRPAPRLARHRTPVRGLYVAGASVHPGGAVHGMSGRSAARALLRDRAGFALALRRRPGG